VYEKKKQGIQQIRPAREKHAPSMSRIEQKEGVGGLREFAIRLSMEGDQGLWWWLGKSYCNLVRDKGPRQNSLFKHQQNKKGLREGTNQKPCLRMGNLKAVG